jgi:hypothetical protein
MSAPSGDDAVTTKAPFLPVIRLCARQAGALLALLLVPLCARAVEVPSWLPRYDLDIHLNVEQHQVSVRQRVTWTNRHPLPTGKVVFNVHSHYVLPAKDIPLFAKMLEILRLAPTEVFDLEGPPCQVQKVTLLGEVDRTGSGAEKQTPADKAQAPGTGAITPPVTLHAPRPLLAPVDLPFAFQKKIDTALEVTLPTEVRQGESITLELAFTLRLPQTQGRWGQWKGVTFLAQWLPVVAYFDQHGWQPVPFIPWHQPFFNEAGIYSARVTLPADQKVGSSGSVTATRDLGDGWQQVDIQGGPLRDFALFSCARFEEHVGQADRVRVRVLALPGHEFYAEQMVHTVREALPVYERWFGPYPYDQFTIVESYFGWNGNECGGLVMIDARIFTMPHMAHNFVDMLVSHELCHQWWYNVVGTNGYAETFMDEGLAVYFSHRLMDQKHGKNNLLLEWPTGLEWLPQIHRDDYRYYTLLGVLGRGEQTPTVQDMPGFTHLVNLSAMTYDRGGKIVGMIEDRLGEAAFLDFMRRLYAKYAFRILRVAEFRHELEIYTGQSWQEFFNSWLYGKGMTDWCVERVTLEPVKNRAARREEQGAKIGPLASLVHPWTSGGVRRGQPCRATIYLRQRGEVLEQTVLGICLDDSENYQIRIPVLPQVPVLDVEEPPARVECLGQGQVRVQVELPDQPTQITVDPDEVLLDRDPSNNTWKPRVRVRITPLYFELDETDLTNAYDRLNIICGPWLYGSTYQDPWYTRSPMLGLRAGVYRTQEFSGGAYMAYRSDDRNLVAGVDGVIDHWPWAHFQVGFNVERSLATLSPEYVPASRGVVFGRYIFNYSSSLYLPPIDYVEVFGAVQNRSLPAPLQPPPPGTDLFQDQTVAGVHYHLDYLTPYWDPEGGFAIDATYQEGLPLFGEDRSFQQLFAQLSAVKTMPAWLNWMKNVPGLSWVPDTRLAARVYGGAALPTNAEIFTLGGGDHFRGFDLSERQGNLVWLASVEWRVPLARGLQWDVCDHVAGMRNLYAAAFYDVGDAYLSGHETGPIAHAVGLGLRLDVAWFSLIERTIFRIDIAKTVNSSSPVQFWFGVRHPF